MRPKMIIPCIDLLGGKVVQLIQGEKLALERTPDEAVELFKGFPLLHIIDLDAAKRQGENRIMIEALLRRIRARVGGGVRTVQDAVALVHLGAEQVIVGSSAFRDGQINFELLSEISREIGKERLMVAVDCKAGKVSVAGWRESVDLSPTEAAKQLNDHVGGLLCTYVDKEGMLQGTDLALFESLRQVTSIPLTAAGGITTLDEVRTLISMDIQVALGMAIYTGHLDLGELRALVLA
jgi:phosphoribosylformimino-5-aminoimidazole carboxamide ribotide isomerase